MALAKLSSAHFLGLVLDDVGLLAGVSLDSNALGMGMA